MVLDEDGADAVGRAHKDIHVAPHARETETCAVRSTCELSHSHTHARTHHE
jgi:hypothetical protein